MSDSKWLKVSANPGDAGRPLESKIRVRVAPEGQPEFDSELRLWGGDNQRPLAADRQTYVLYDPEHPEHCEIDKERLHKEFGPGRDGKAPLMIPSERERIGAEMVAAKRSGDVAEMRRLAAKLAAGGANVLAVPGSVPPAATGSEDPLEHMQKVAEQFSGSVSPGAPGLEDPLERLQKLAGLRDRGVLTDAEFAAEKAKILDQS